ncbi:MAG: P-II family nitrogen regulator [Ignavibacteriae bacterium]|nr:P-II family nitrogen regulator [Ignavibacteriota bacterium]
MDEIKAYIRPALGHRVIQALKTAGVTNISAAHVKGIGLFEDPRTEEYDAEVIEKSSDMLKLEIICMQTDVERFVDAIKQHAHTGNSGDGAIFVSPVGQAIRIKTGEEGLA